MEIRHITFKNQLILTIHNQKIQITPFLTQEPGTIKLGINAPIGVCVNREEIYKRKQEVQQLEQQGTLLADYTTKIPALFKELLTVTHKSEKLEVAAKNLFDKTKILTPKSLEKIACGEMPTTKWVVACAIDILITDKPKSMKQILSSNDLFDLWARPLLNRSTEKATLLSKAQRMDIPGLTKKIINYTKH